MIYILSPPKRLSGCGVSDHTSILVEKLLRGGTHVRVVYYEATTPKIDEFESCDLMFVQLSIYGYSRRGVPTWLPGLLRKIKARGVRIITNFHELWARKENPRGSAFWLSPLQRLICRNIFNASDIAVFNVEWAYNWGLSHRSSRSVSYLIPTFSNVGEPVNSLEWSIRDNTIVVFGNPNARKQVYIALDKRLMEMAESKIPYSLCDIGSGSPEIDDLLRKSPGISSSFASVTRLGALSADLVSVQLQKSKLGIFAVSQAQAGKSGIVAAYMSHGLCPVSIHDERGLNFRSVHPPLPAIHYLALNQIDLTSVSPSAVLSSIAQNARIAYVGSDKMVDLIATESRHLKGLA